MYVCVCLCSNAGPTALLRASGFRARPINDVERGLFSIHAPLGQTTLRAGRVSVLVISPTSSFTRSSQVVPSHIFERFKRTS